MTKKTETQNETELKTELRVPRKYQVIFFNDDYTPMAFVIELLMYIFHKDTEAAKELTENIHIKGKAVVGVYPKNIAEMKVKLSNELATANEYPLKCKMEAL